MKLPALIEDMPMADYLADIHSPEPSLTSSAIRRFAEMAPAKARLRDRRLNPDFVPDHRTDFDLGTAAHSLFVGQGDPIEVIDVLNKHGEIVTDYRTKAAREARDAAYAAGSTPLLKHQWKAVEEMAACAVVEFGKTDIADVVSSLKTKREATIIWIERGVHCRCRPDFLSLETDPPTLVHFKTTKISINPESIMRHAGDMGWHVIAAHYRAGVKALTGKAPVQVFAVQEVAPPYLCKPCILHRQFLHYGQSELERALFLWGQGLKTGEWPGLGPETAEVRPPAWLRHKYEI